MWRGSLINISSYGYQKAIDKHQELMSIEMLVLRKRGWHHQTFQYANPLKYIWVFLPH